MFPPILKQDLWAPGVGQCTHVNVLSLAITDATARLAPGHVLWEDLLAST